MEFFIGQINMFGGNFAPRNWALCDGALLQISQNTALFSILGTTYGGDGRTTFALPDLRGRVAVHPGTGPGLTHRRLGEKGGKETVTLTSANLPSHKHSLMATTTDANSLDPASGVPGKLPGPGYDTGGTADKTMAAGSVGSTGDNAPHDNEQPYECVNFIILLVGTYPSRS